MRKILMICLVIITTFILLTSCSKPENLSLSEGILDNNPSLGISDDTLTNNQIGKDNEILWQADLNHDGNEEKIIVEILNNLDTGEGAKISVYNNNSDLLIYSANGDLPHAGWNGFYLYYDENGAYLMNWLPTMYQGHGNYTYEVFSFNAYGDKIILDNESFEFYFEDLSYEYKGLEDFIKYIQKVNSYLLKSSLIIDTNGGTLLYGTQDTQTINPFIPQWLFGVY